MDRVRTLNGVVQYCRDVADAAQQDPKVADALRSVAIHTEALLEREQQAEQRTSNPNLVGKPLVELRQDPDLVPRCPACGELHQHSSDDPDGRWSCGCTDETYLLHDWLFWVAAHTACRHCGVPPSGDQDGLYCGTHDGNRYNVDHCCASDTPVQPAEWIRRNAQENPTSEVAGQIVRINKLLTSKFGDEGIDQTVARLIQRVDQLALDQQQRFDYLSSVQAADFATMMDKLGCDPVAAVAPPKPTKPDPSEELPLEGCILPYYDVVLFERLGEWNVRCLLEAEDALEDQLSTLHFPSKQAALDAIKAMENNQC